MKQRDFIDVIQSVDPTLTRADAAKVIKIFSSAIIKAMSEGQNVMIYGFGSFLIKRRKERRAKKPNTDEIITIEARNVPVFKPSEKLRDVVK